MRQGERRRPPALSPPDRNGPLQARGSLRPAEPLRRYGQGMWGPFPRRAIEFPRHLHYRSVDRTIDRIRRAFFVLTHDLNT